MAEKMFRVTAQAKSRNVNGQIFNSFWSGGKQWSALDETTHVLTQAQMDDIQKDHDGGFPISIVKVEDVPEGDARTASRPETPQATASAPGADQAGAAAGSAAGEPPRPPATPPSDVRTLTGGTHPAGAGGSTAQNPPQGEQDVLKPPQGEQKPPQGDTKPPWEKPQG